MFQSPKRVSPTFQGPRSLSKRTRTLRRLFSLAFVFFLALAFSACGLYTTRPIQANSTGQYNQFNQNFDPVTYANSIWASKVIPTITTKSTDLPTLLAALKANAAATEKRYAAPSSDGSFNFMVKGQGTITSVSTGTRAGSVTLKLAGVDSKTTILLQIGPVIAGTALRDSVGFINFTQFSNQVQFAEVSDQLNAHAAQSLQAIPFSTLKGKEITFYGAFTLLDPQYISILPAKVVTGGNA